MAKHIEALVNPELLVWARESIGLGVQEAARKIGIKPERLEQWERGELVPTISQLRKAAKIAYKRPLAVFYLSKPPKTFDAMRDFRRLPDDQRTANSSALLLEIRRARDRRQIALDLSQNLEEGVSNFVETTSLNDDPDTVARRARKLLGISLEEQFDWRTGYQAFNSWKSAIEKLGVLIFQTSHLRGSVEIQEIRGFSISEKLFPVIVVNSKDSVNGKIFTLLHEFTHLLLNNGGMCDLREYRNLASDEQRVEVFCNRVAGTTLVPSEVLSNDELVLNRGRNPEWTDEELGILADKFLVSREVILRRLLILGRTSEEFYQLKRKDFLERYEQRPAKGAGAPPYYRLVIRNEGQPYIRLVLNAYYQNAITASDLSDYLGVKLDQISKIEKAVMGIPRVGE
jgi:Zn-dependent peptidase ImmA (M78 family)/transcriptional regulator with XRE-family HTH domain